jgi:hypothetical protein
MAIFPKALTTPRATLQCSKCKKVVTFTVLEWITKFGLGYLLKHSSIEPRSNCEGVMQDPESDEHDYGP